MSLILASEARKKSQEIKNLKHNPTDQEIFAVFSEILSTEIEAAMNSGRFACDANLKNIWGKACSKLEKQHCTVDLFPSLDYLVPLFQRYSTDVLVPAGYRVDIRFLNHNTLVEFVLSWMEGSNE